MTIRTLLAVIILGWLPLAAAEAREAKPAQETFTTPPLPTRAAPRHYCGIYCVYAAARIEGRHVEFEQLVNERYLASREGSTTSNLLSALHDVELEGHLCSFLTLEKLRWLHQPTILHVRSPGLPSYRHWVLFLGFDGDSVRLYDPPHETGNVSEAELLSIWDGVGIVVGPNRPVAALPVPLSISFVAFLAGTACVIGLASRWLGGCKGLVAATVVLSVAAHLVSPSGFLRAPAVLREVQTSAFEQEVPVLDHDATKRLIESSDCTVVDARPRSAYDEYHLPGAINVPVDSGYLALKHAAMEIDQDKPVVVYCQSDQCGWSDEIARQLLSRGLRECSIYRGGVKEWRAKQK